MKILVTGGTGFLGSALCAEVEKSGHDVVRLSSKNCDLTKDDSLLRWSGEKYDQIYHLAAWTQAGDFCLYHPAEQWIINQRINTNVLSWWKQCQPQAKLIAMGTSCAYDPGMEHAEENYLIGEPIESLYTYAMTKRMLYAGLLAMRKQFGMNYLHLVPSTLYGPGYHTDLRQMHFIFDLIRKIMRGKLYGEPVVLWGDGYQKREVIFIDDFVKIAVSLAAAFDNETINIGAGEEHTIRHFAKLICDRVGYDFDSIKYDTSRYVGAKAKCLITRKLKKYFPELKLMPLNEGLSRTIDWFDKEKDRVLKEKA